MFTAGRPRAFAIRSASGVFPGPGGRQSRAPAPALSDAHDDPVQGNSPGSPSGSPSRQQLPSRSTPPGATRARPRSAGCVLRSPDSPRPRPRITGIRTTRADLRNACQQAVRRADHARQAPARPDGSGQGCVRRQLRPPGRPLGPRDRGGQPDARTHQTRRDRVRNLNPGGWTPGKARSSTGQTAPPETSRAAACAPGKSSTTRDGSKSRSRYRTAGSRRRPRPPREARLAAGSGQPVWDETQEMEVSVKRSPLASWAHVDRLKCARVVGDSMSLAVGDGDLVVLDSGRTEPLDGRVFGLLTGDDSHL